MEDGITDSSAFRRSSPPSSAYPSQKAAILYVLPLSLRLYSALVIPPNSPSLMLSRSSRSDMALPYLERSLASRMESMVVRANSAASSCIPFASSDPKSCPAEPGAPSAPAGRYPSARRMFDARSPMPCSARKPSAEYPWTEDQETVSANSARSSPSESPDSSMTALMRASVGAGESWITRLDNEQLIDLFTLR